MLAHDKSVAEKVLKDHAVSITRDINLSSLMPYLIQHGCLTCEDMSQLPKTEMKRNNNLKFIDMVQQRGTTGFNAFMKALAHFTSDEPGEGAHTELLHSLEKAVKLSRRHKPSLSSQGSRTSSMSDPFSSISTLRPIPEGGVAAETDGDKDQLLEKNPVEEKVSE